MHISKHNTFNRKLTSKTSPNLCVERPLKEKNINLSHYIQVTNEKWSKSFS